MEQEWVAYSFDYPLVKNLLKFKPQWNDCLITFKKIYSWKWEKLKIADKEFLLSIKKQDFSTLISETKWKCISLCFYFMIGFLCKMYLHEVFLWRSEKQTPNNKYLLEVLKRRSKVQEKNMSCERALTFDQWKNIFWKL